MNSLISRSLGLLKNAGFVRFIYIFIFTSLITVLIGYLGGSDSFAEEKVQKKLSNKLTLKSEDGNNSITFGLKLQLQFQYTSKDNGSGVDRGNETLFRFRRIRPIISGTLINKNLSYYIQFSTAPGSLELIDAYINYRFIDQLSLMVGQYKIPFTRYRVSSVQFVDWAIVSKYFGSERQLGLSLHNCAKKPPRFEYSFGVFQGQNARNSHGIGISKVSGDEVLNPSDFTDPKALDELHPLLAGKFFYNHNGIITKTDGDFEKGPFRFAIGLSAAYDFQPEAYRDFALRFAPEFLMKMYGFSFSATYYMGLYEKNGEISKMDIALHGVLANLGYVIGSQFEIAARFALVSTTDNFRSDTQTRAANLIAAKTTDLNNGANGVTQSDVDDLTSQYKSAGLMQKEWEATLGFNYYIFGKTLMLQTDVGWLRHEITGSADKNDVVARVQLQLCL